MWGLISVSSLVLKKKTLKTEHFSTRVEEVVSVSLFIRRSNDYFPDFLKLPFPKANNRIRDGFVERHKLNLLKK